MLGRIPSLRLRYQTPVNSPAETIRRGYLIPNDPVVLAAWGEILNILAKDQIWDESGGGLSALDTASLMAEAILPVACFEQTTGDGMETIVPHFTLLADGAYTEFQWVDSYDVLELSMILKTDANSVADGFVLSINGTTSGYAITRTWMNQNAAVNADIDNPSSGTVENSITGNLGLFHSPVLIRFWRGYGVWFGMAWSSQQRSASLFNHMQATILWNSDTDINTLRVSPLSGSNLLVNSQFMLRGVRTP